jgi:WD40 repeat protein
MQLHQAGRDGDDGDGKHSVVNKWEDASPDCLRLVFACLAGDARDVVRCSLVCRWWRSAIFRNTLIWRLLCEQRRWPQQRGRDWFLTKHARMLRCVPEVQRVLHTRMRQHEGGVALVHAVPPQRCYDWPSNTYKELNVGVLISIGTAPYFEVNVWQRDTSSIANADAEKKHKKQETKQQQQQQENKVNNNSNSNSSSGVVTVSESSSLKYSHVRTVSIKNNVASSSSSATTASAQSNTTFKFSASHIDGHLFAFAETNPLSLGLPAVYVLDLRHNNMDKTGPVPLDHGHKSAITCLRVHAERGVALSGSYDATTRLWNVATKKQLACFSVVAPDANTVTCKAATVWSVAFHPTNADWICTGGEDNVVRIWSIRRGTLLRELKQHSSTVMCVEFDDCADEFVLGNDLDELKDATAEQGQEEEGDDDDHSESKQQQSSSDEQEEKVLQNRQPAHAAILFSCGYDNTVCMFNFATAQCLRVFRGHTAVCFALLSYPGFIVSASRDATIRVWDKDNGEQLHCFELKTSRDIKSLAKIDACSFASGSYDGAVNVFRFAAKQQRASSSLAAITAPEKSNCTVM